MNLLNSKIERIFNSHLNAYCKTRPSATHVAGLLINDVLVATFSSSNNDLKENVQSLRFPIASMSKVFCACAILKLRDRGVLDLDKPVSFYLPSFQKKIWQNISLIQLLHMTSGLPYDNPWGDRLLGLSDEEIISLVNKEILLVPNNNLKFNYSNLGYIILGLIISKVTSLGCCEYIKEEFLNPMGMLQTDWIKTEDSYVKGTDLVFLEKKFSADVIKGAGGMFGGLVSSIEDLAVWVTFLQSAFFGPNEFYDRILASSSRVEIQTPMTKFINTASFGYSKALLKYCKGLNFYETNGGTSLGHSGGLPGFGSHFRWSNQAKVGIIFLSNSTYFTGSAVAGEILDQIVHNLDCGNQPPSEILVARGAQLKCLIKDLDFSNADKIFSSNFFLDNNLETFQREIRNFRSGLTNVDEHIILSEEGLSAKILFENRSMFFSLSPGEGGKIQELMIEDN